MRGTISIIAAAMLAAGCSGGLRSGDLLFQQNEGDFTDAVEASTDGDFSHVGIAEVTSEGAFVLEASPSEGVVRTPLQDFLDASAHATDGTPLVQAYRIRRGTPGWDRHQVQKALQRARSHLGKPYDFAFSPGDSALYCSELVRECYRRRDGTPLFADRPMHFTDSTGTILPYWDAYYAALGTAVPEGVPGTNPNGLSRDPVLRPLPVWPVR